jgi:hypothetical protein
MSSGSVEERIRGFIRQDEATATDAEALTRRLDLENYLREASRALSSTPPDPDLLNDGEVEDQARALEAELLDAYARGELSAEDRGWVTEMAAASPETRRRLDFARDFVREKRSGSSTLRRWIQIAAILAMSLGALWVVERQLVHHQPPDGGHSSSLSSVPRVVDLPWDNRRGGGEVIPPLRIPREAGILDLRLALPPSGRAHQRFQVDLRGPDGRPLGSWTLGKTGDDSQTLRWSAAAAGWATGSYTLELTAIDPDGARIGLGDTEFDIARVD